ncbi:MAG TPA: Gfo/Idh/MocA family oxidoreductase [Candidatus Limnocylindrales bacterium]|jgi:predicted dehydrogenase|nr:Gfo/Idh/MocA family oxidoreductase [Candidatus Limnocylindrales bacterium]
MLSPSAISGIGAAVIGTGFIGTVHVEALRRIGAQVRGVLGSSPERGRARAESLGVAHAYPSLDALLDDPEVGVVHVTSPNHLHVEQASAILAAGRHVVCEKPLAMTAEESARLVDEAARSGLVNAVNFNIRFYPLNQHVRELVADGSLGEVRFVTGHYLQDWLLHDTDWNWRLEPGKGGSLRAVGDIGSHWLDLVTFLTGQPIVAVMADLATFVPLRRQPKGAVETFSTERSAETVGREMATEDVATILIRFANGARGAVAVSQISAGRKNSLRWEIDGSIGAAAWDSESPEHLWLGHRDRPNELLLRNPALMGAAGRAAAALPGGHVEGFADTFGALFRAIYADVAAGRPSPRPAYATFADGHDEMLVGDAVAASARAGRWAEVARTLAPTTATVEAG